MTDQELLSLCNEHLDYNPDTGVFIRKISNNRSKAGSIAGSRHCCGYTEIRVNGKLCLAHRLAFLMVWEYLPKYIDHINHNKEDNRIINLRECTASQNLMNSSVRKNTASGYKGVKRAVNKWRAGIKVNGKQLHLGVFPCKHEAAKAYNEAALKYHGEFACLNKIN